MKSDAELIEKTLAGEWRNYALLVDRYERKVFNYTNYIMKVQEDAEEVTQDVFVKAYRSLHTFRAEALFSTWLLKIAYYECLTRLRKKSPSKVTIEEHQSEELSEPPSQSLDIEDRSEILKHALSQLKEEERSVITLFYYNELSIQETVMASGLTESNVKILLHRGRKKLLKILSGMGVKEAIL